MAQTLIMEPRIVLIDEPFSALDVHTRRLMHRVLLDLWGADRRSLRWRIALPLMRAVPALAAPLMRLRPRLPELPR